MFFDDKIWMAKNEEKVSLLLRMANRHGLVTGATGTGKTITVKVMAESFSDAGVSVFLSDIKGDLTGMSQPGINTEDMQNTQGGGDVNAETIVTISNLTLVGPIVSIPVVSCAK